VDDVELPCEEGDVECGAASLVVFVAPALVAVVVAELLALAAEELELPG
jgi:hypothetical protein